MVLVSIAVFVVVVLLLWMAAKASARLHRRAYQSDVQPPAHRYDRREYLSGGGGGQEMTNIINVYPGRGYHGTQESAHESYEMGYSGPRE